MDSKTVRKVKRIIGRIKPCRGCIAWESQWLMIMFWMRHKEHMEQFDLPRFAIKIDPYWNR